MLTTVDAKNERRLELAATVLLALATVATAWSAYQAREWTGEQAQGTAHATAARIAVNRAAALANRQVQIDVATFIQWVDARAEGRPGAGELLPDPLSEGVRAGVPRLARDEAVHEQRRAEDAVRRCRSIGSRRTQRANASS